MYTINDIEVLLTSSGYNQGIPIELSNNNQDCYFYPFQNLTSTLLLTDLTNYCKSVLGKNNNRKVCFLSTAENNQLYALLLECEGINQTAVTMVNDFIINHRELTHEEWLNNPIFLQALSKLYQQSSCTFLSSIEPPIGWEQFILKLYKPLTLIVQPLPTTSVNIIFTEFIRAFFKQGEFPLIVDAKRIYQSHLQLSLTVLRNKLQLFKQTDPEQYFSIQVYLEILFKYAALREKRKKLSALTLSLEQAELVTEMDRSFKKSIYKENVDVEQFLAILSINTLTSLISCQDANAMTAYLQQEHVKQLQQLQQWQINLNQQQAVMASSWNNYLPWKMKQGLQAIYQFTWVGLSAELFKWAGDGVAAIFTDNPLVILSKRIINHAVYQLTLLMTASPQQASKAVDKVSQLSSAVYLVPWHKVLGGGLGLILTYYSGANHLVKILLINNLGIKLSQLLAAENLNDEQAKITEHNYRLGIVGYSRILNLLLAAVESFSIQKSYYFWSALGGTIGSLSATYLAKNTITDLKILDGQVLTQGQILTLFFISMAGLELGQMLTRYGINIFSRFNDCTYAKVVFEKLINEKPDDYLAWSAQCSNSLNPFLFWSKAETPLHLNWVTRNKKYFETECEIQHENGYVVCDQPTELQAIKNIISR